MTKRINSYKVLNKLFISIIAFVAILGLVFTIFNNKAKAMPYMPSTYTVIVEDDANTIFKGWPANVLQENDILAIDYEGDPDESLFVTININGEEYNKIPKGAKCEISIFGYFQLELDGMNVNLTGTFYLVGDLTISKNSTVGQTLTATYDDSEYDSSLYMNNKLSCGYATATYQWFRNGEKIEDATSDTYTITKDDLGSQIYVELLGTGLTEYSSISSNPVTVYEAHEHGKEGEDDYIKYTIPLDESYDGKALETGNYFLISNLNISSGFLVQADAIVNICLNGYVVNLVNNAPCFIYNYGSVSIKDCCSEKDIPEYYHYFEINESESNYLAIWNDENKKTAQVSAIGGCITGYTGNSDQESYGIIFSPTGSVSIEGITFIGNKADCTNLVLQTKNSTNVNIKNVRVIYNEFKGYSNYEPVGLFTINSNSSVSCDLEIYNLTIANNNISRIGDKVGKGSILYVGSFVNIDELIKNINICDNNVLASSVNGLLYFGNSYFEIGKSSFSGNNINADSINGGIINCESCYILDSYFASNLILSQTINGGLIHLESDEALGINNTVFKGNEITCKSSNKGGLISCLGDSFIVIYNSTFEQNELDCECAYYGGLIYTENYINLHSTEITNNNISGTQFFGGLVYAKSSITLIGDESNKTLINKNIIESNDVSFSTVVGGLLYSNANIKISNYSLLENSITINADGNKNINGMLICAYGSDQYLGIITLYNVDIIKNNVSTDEDNTSRINGGLFYSNNTIIFEKITLNENTVTTDNTINGGLIYSILDFMGYSFEAKENVIITRQVGDYSETSKGLLIYSNNTVNIGNLCLIESNKFAVASVVEGGLFYCDEVFMEGYINSNNITSKYVCDDDKINCGGLIYVKNVAYISGNIEANNVSVTHAIEGGLIYTRLDDYTKATYKNIIKSNITENNVIVTAAYTIKGALIYSKDFCYLEGCEFNGNAFSNSSGKEVNVNYGLIYCKNDIEIYATTFNGNAANLNYGSLSGGIAYATDVRLINVEIKNNDFSFSNAYLLSSAIPCGGLIAAEKTLNVSSTTENPILIENNKINQIDKTYNIYNGGLFYCGSNFNVKSTNPSIKFIENEVCISGVLYGGLIYSEIKEINGIQIVDNEITCLYGGVYGGAIYLSNNNGGVDYINNLTIKTNSFSGMDDNPESISNFFGIIYAESDLLLTNCDFEGNSINSFEYIKNGFVRAVNGLTAENVFVVKNNLSSYYYDGGIIFNIGSSTNCTSKSLTKVTIVENEIYGTEYDSFGTSFIIAHNTKSGKSFEIEYVNIYNNTIIINQLLNGIINYSNGGILGSNIEIYENNITASGFNGFIHFDKGSFDDVSLSIISDSNIYKNEIIIKDKYLNGLNGALINANNIDFNGDKISENYVEYNGDAEAIGFIQTNRASFYVCEINNNLFINNSKSNSLGFVFNEDTDFSNTEIKDNVIKCKKLEAMMKLFSNINYECIFNNFTFYKNNAVCESLENYDSFVIKYNNKPELKLKGVVYIYENAINETKSGFKFNYSNINNPVQFNSDELSDSSLIEIGVGPNFGNTDEYCFATNAGKLFKSFVAVDKTYYVKENDNCLCYCGRILNNPTIKATDFKLYLDDLVNNGEKTEFQWYNGYELIEGECDNVINLDQFAFGSLYCVMTSSSGVTIKSDVIEIAPKIINDPSENNMYTFTTSSIEGPNAKIEYSWYQKDIQNVNCPQKVKDDILTLFPEGLLATVHLNGSSDKILIDSTINKETENYCRSNVEYKDEQEVSRMFGAEIYLKKGQQLFVWSNSKISVKYMMEGKVTNSQDSDNNIVKFTDSYKAENDGVYTILIEADKNAEFAFYIYNEKETCLNNNNAKTFGINDKETFNGVIFISMYDNGYFYMPNEYKGNDRYSLGVLIESNGNEKINVLQEQVKEIDVYQVLLYKKVNNNLVLVDSCISFYSKYNSLYISERGEYYIVSLGCVNDEVLSPAMMLTRSFVTRAEVLESEQYNGGGFVLTNKLNSTGRIYKKENNDYFGFDTYLKAGEIITVKINADSPWVSLYYNSDKAVRDNDKVISKYYGNTITYVALKDGYHTFVLSDYSSVDTSDIYMDAYLEKQYNYLQQIDKSNALRNVENGTYICVATYTQGNNEYKLFSNECEFIGHNINYDIEEEISGAKPSDSYRYVVGEVAKVIEPKCERQGYQMIGWAIDKNAINVDYYFNDNIIIDNDVTLYPVYRMYIAVDPAIESYIYGDESAKYIVINNKSLTDFNVFYYVDDAYTSEVPTDAGAYNVKIKRYQDDTYAFIETIVKEGFVINKAKVNKPTVEGTYTFNGNEQTVTLNGVESFMSTTDPLTQIDASTYIIEYSLDNNHEWVEGTDGLVVWTINKLVLTQVLSNTDNINITYGDSLVEPTATTNDPTYNNYVSFSKKYQKVIDLFNKQFEDVDVIENAGNYAIVYSAISVNSNVVIDETATVWVNISKKIVSKPIINGTYIYNTLAQSLELSGVESYMNTSDTLTQTNVGSYDISYTLLNDNYEWEDGFNGTITWTVEKPELSLVVSNTNTINITYGDSFEAPTSKISNSSYSSLYTLKSDFVKIANDVETSVDEIKNAGNYAIIYYAETSDENVVINDRIYVYVNIGKKIVSQPSIIGNYTYNGETQNVALEGVEEFMSTTSSLNQVNAGSYEIVYTIDDNYEWATGNNGTITWTIDKALVSEPSITDTYTYNGTLITPNIVGIESYMTTESVVSQTEAGDYTIAYTLDSNHAWLEDVDGVIAWSIKKAQNSISCDVTEITFDEGEKVTYPSINVLFGDVNPSINANDITAPGIYNVEFKVDDNNSYSSVSLSIKVIVNEKQKTVINIIDPVTKEAVNSNVVVKAYNSEKKEVCLSPEIALKVEAYSKKSVITAIDNNELTIDYYNMIDEQVKLGRYEYIGNIFTIKLVKVIDGVETELQPSDLDGVASIKIAIQIPEDINVENITRILHVHNENDIESIDFDINNLVNGVYEIEVSKLSEFAFIYVDTTKEILTFATILLIIVMVIVMNVIIIELLKRQKLIREEENYNQYMNINGNNNPKAC